jgi:hypothetical protein
LYLEYGYLQQTPFYRQAWFSMSVACLGTIMIILVTAVLCVKSKSHKYKRKFQFLFHFYRKNYNNNFLISFMCRRSTKNFRRVDCNVNR